MRFFFFFSSRRRHTRWTGDWSSDVCSSDLGIAVGMATNIPPHNLAEVCTALLKLLDNEDLGNAPLCRYAKGPDFPTGGQILNSLEEIREIYKTGSGPIRLRGTWDIGPETRSTKTIASP